MRISDWSSDVCSSDLRGGGRRIVGAEAAVLKQARDDRTGNDDERDRRRQGQQERELEAAIEAVHRLVLGAAAQLAGQVRQQDDADGDADEAERELVDPVGEIEEGESPFLPGRDRGAHRSEEHTSELQSLMRISYAVFCLKKKITSNK